MTKERLAELEKLTGWHEKLDHLTGEEREIVNLFRKIEGKQKTIDWLAKQVKNPMKPYSFAEYKCLDYMFEDNYNPEDHTEEENEQHKLHWARYCDICMDVHGGPHIFEDIELSARQIAERDERMKKSN